MAGVERVGQHRGAHAEPAADRGQCVQRPGVAEGRAPVELGKPVVDGHGRVAHRVVGVGGEVEESPQSDHRLPAPDPATAAASALRLDDHVAELAGVPLSAAQRPAVGDDPAADADLAEQHEDVLALRVSGRGLGERGQVALVLDRDRVGVAEPGPQQLADRHVVPAEVGAEGEPVALAVHEAGHAHGEADRLDVTVREVGERLPDQLGEPVEDLLGRDRAGVEGELVLADDLAA